jgi:hypothetical protein
MGAPRIRNMERADAHERILANTKPIYLSGRNRHNESKIAEAKAILEQKAAAEAAGENGFLQTISGDSNHDARKLG